MMRQHTVFTAPAKINLGLYVRRKRADGYHDIETLFLPIPLHDTLKVSLHDGPDVLTCDHPEVPVDGRNLALQAVAALRRHWGRRSPKQGIRIVLHKRIPPGGGLGGGSSDAGAVLRELPLWLDLPVRAAALKDMALRIGSDVPFFLKPRLSVARGRGEQLRTLLWDVRGWLLLVLPGFGVSTGWAYSRITPRGMGGASLAGIIRPVIRQEASLPPDALINDFEDPVFKRHTILQDCKSVMLHQGAALAAMSGSGSTLYGLFHEKKTAGRAMREIHALHIPAHVWRLG